MKKLVKSRDKKLCGVCGGFAEYLNLDPTLVRVLYAIITLICGFGSLGIIAYIVCAIIIPEDDGIIG